MLDEVTRRSVVQRLLRAIAGLWSAVDTSRVDDAWPSLLPVLVAVVRDEFDFSARSARDAYLRERGARLGGWDASVWPAQVAVLDETALVGLRTSLTVVGPVRVKTAMARTRDPQRASQAALVGLQGVATRAALSGARETTLDNVADDPRVSGWARVPRPDACWWCLMLATRGGAYRSRESALTSRSGKAFHDHCKCMVIPVWDEQWYPPRHVQRAEELYNSSTHGKSGKKALDAFRHAVAAERSADQEEKNGARSA